MEGAITLSADAVSVYSQLFEFLLLESGEMVSYSDLKKRSNGSNYMMQNERI